MAPGFLKISTALVSSLAAAALVLSACGSNGLPKTYDYAKHNGPYRCDVAGSSIPVEVKATDSSLVITNRDNRGVMFEYRGKIGLMAGGSLYYIEPSHGTNRYSNAIFSNDSLQIFDTQEASGFRNPSNPIFCSRVK